MPSPTPLTYNAYVSEIANLAVMQTQTVSGVVQGVDASFNAMFPGILNYAESRDIFSSFTQLTEGQVIGWVHEALGEDGVAQWEGSVDSHLSFLAGPATVTPDLPWAPQA